MQVNVLEVATGVLVEAIIVEIGADELPSMQEGWHFNFAKELQGLKNCSCYALKVMGDNRIEGCVSFQLKTQSPTEPSLPFMPLLEVAPHNFGSNKIYQHVAGCLIAYAYLLSSRLGERYNKGVLTFEVSEKNIVHERKLMAVYSQKYGVRHWTESSTMLITRDAGEVLLAKYLTNS